MKDDSKAILLFWMVLLSSFLVTAMKLVGWLYLVFCVIFSWWDFCFVRISYPNKVYTEHDMYFLGRGTDYNVAMEGSLKLKEISYIHSEAYAAGELKHGPIALIENGVTVISIITNSNLVEKALSNVQEVITRGAKTLVITNQKLNNTNFNFIIHIPETDSIISPILSVIPLQFLSYYIAKNKGLDVDKPRNLAKSVTVE